MYKIPHTWGQHYTDMHITIWTAIVFYMGFTHVLRSSLALEFTKPKKQHTYCYSIIPHISDCRFHKTSSQCSWSVMNSNIVIHLTSEISSVAGHENVYVEWPVTFKNLTSRLLQDTTLVICPIKCITVFLEENFTTIHWSVVKCFFSLQPWKLDCWLSHKLLWSSLLLACQILCVVEALPVGVLCVSFTVSCGWGSSKHTV